MDQKVTGLSPVGVTLHISHLHQVQVAFSLPVFSPFSVDFVGFVNQCVNRNLPMNTTIEAVLCTSRTFSEQQTREVYIKLTARSKKILLAVYYWPQDRFAI